MKLALILALSFFSLHALAEWNHKVFFVKDQREISKQDLIQELSKSNIIVLGEKHYTQEVQFTEAQIIKDVVEYSQAHNQFTLNWEFLNASAQDQTFKYFQQIKNQELTIEEFLKITQGTSKASVYAPLIEITAHLGGKLYGGNLSREEKAPVTQRGLGALDPRHLPPQFQLGGENYFERFAEVMSGHATPEQIKNYFAAQSLVDDVIAYHLYQDTSDKLKFLIIGAFHSQYNDGVVSRLKSRNPSVKIANIEIIDAKDYSETELKDLFQHEKYGDRADFIYFLNEPVK